MVMAMTMMMTNLKVKSSSEWRRLRNPRHGNDKNTKKKTMLSSDPGARFAWQDGELEDSIGGNGRSGRLTWRKDR